MPLSNSDNNVLFWFGVLLNILCGSSIYSEECFRHVFEISYSKFFIPIKMFQIGDSHNNSYIKCRIYKKM